MVICISCLLFKDDLILKICSNLKGGIFTLKIDNVIIATGYHRILDVFKFNSTTPKYQICLQCCRKRGLCRRFDNLDAVKCNFSIQNTKYKHKTQIQKANTANLGEDLIILMKLLLSGVSFLIRGAASITGETNLFP